METEADLSNDAGLFEEPEDFRPPPPKPRQYVVQRVEPFGTLNIELVGHHSLWAHELWNAGVVMGRYCDENPALCKNKNTLELGAAAAVPSLVAALQGASQVVITDYPEDDLIAAIQKNVDMNIPEDIKPRVHSLGYLWGSDVAPLLAPLPEGQLFDVIFLSDLVFNHGQHEKMLQTCMRCLAADGLALCFFTHHRPWKEAEDMNFITLAAAAPFSLRVERLPDVIMPVMFPNDPGSAEVRATVKRFVFRR
eukprot:m.43754 g.43754  ORF g.43754 m.43754 type:complete len:251 (-) comp10819_c0_seq2:31-783(-)